MNNIFKFYLNKFIIIYLNDILIYSNTLKKHVKHLKLIFQKLEKYQFYAKSKKYNIEIETIEFCEYEFDVKCIKFASIKMRIIKN